MELNENARIDTSQIEDQRGSPGGGGLSGGGLPIPIPTGGGKGGLIITLIVVVASVLLGGGFGLNALTDDGGQGTTPAWKVWRRQPGPEPAGLPQRAVRQLDPGLLAGRLAAELRQAVPEGQRQSTSPAA